MGVWIFFCRGGHLYCRCLVLLKIICAPIIYLPFEWINTSRTRQTVARPWEILSKVKPPAPFSQIIIRFRQMCQWQKIDFDLSEMIIMGPQRRSPENHTNMVWDILYSMKAQALVAK